VPTLTADDHLLVSALGDLGIRVEPAVWNDPATDWSRCDGVVIRSTWDYHLAHAGFMAWLDKLERAGIAVLNPPALVRWNSEKTYLRSLADAGVAVVPTQWAECDDTTPLDDVLHAEGWDDAVVKPAVSASAHQTWRTSRARAGADEAKYRAMVAAGRVLVQPFLDVVAAEGEWSLLFYGGEYSHAVRKRPRAGDFRVQKEFGGTAERDEPSLAVIAAARQALVCSEQGRGSSVYARVDGCEIGGAFVLMEIELIEPDLFLRSHPDAPTRLATVIAERTIGPSR
jgi:glutathione synthase/RimK-type ligase-like ATP-grasp enzyme